MSMPASWRIGFSPAPSSGTMRCPTNGVERKLSTTRKKPSRPPNTATTSGISDRGPRLLTRSGGRCRRLKLRRSLGKQSRRLEPPVDEVPFPHSLNARAEEVGRDAAVLHGHRLRLSVDRESDLLRLVVADHRIRRH